MPLLFFREKKELVSLCISDEAPIMCRIASNFTYSSTVFLWITIVRMNPLGFILNHYRAGTKPSVIFILVSLWLEPA
uniref:Uncharacterized protein n=1 Tax=Anguilla anguilla TaxID=7936 RepID=A0A0E9S773_ANGAN